MLHTLMFVIIEFILSPHDTGLRIHNKPSIYSWKIFIKFPLFSRIFVGKATMMVFLDCVVVIEQNRSNHSRKKLSVIHTMFQNKYLNMNRACHRK